MEKMVKRILAKLMTVTLISSISFTSLTVNVSTLNAGSVFEQSAANGIISDDIIKKNQEKDLTSEDEKYGEETSKRMEMKRLISSFREQNPYIVQNIFKSIENINLNCVISYHKNGKRTHFLDDYDLKN